MSDSRQIVALSLGSNRITMGVFSRNGKKLILNKYASRYLSIDPSANAPRQSLMSASVAELAAELGVKGGQLNYSISSQDVFIRFLKLPPITNTDIGQLVTFEAQQQIPFPLNEIVWDYQLLPPAEGGLQEVVIVAIKADALNSMNDEFMGLKFKTGKVDCSATALFNAYKDSYPNETEPVMLIDVGAKTTDIIYTEAGKFFTRSVSAAGVYVTSGIARDLGISFAEAEQLKQTQGMVSMTNGQMEGVDPTVAALATSIRNAMTRVASEIQRTTNHYRAQIHGSAPVKAYLCGGGAVLHYTKEFLEERLGIPVAFFNPLHNVGVGKQVSVDTISREAFLLGDIVGLAVSVAGRGKIDIDLEPTVVALMREAGKKFPKVLAGSLAAVIGAGVFTYFGQQEVERAKTEEAQIEAIATKAKRLASSISSNEQTIEQYDGKLKDYTNMTLQRYGYIDLLKRFVDMTHSDAFWIVDFDPVINFGKHDGTTIDGTSVINDAFERNKGTSLTTKVADATDADDRATFKKAESPEWLYANAIRFKGFAFVNKGGDKVAQDIKNKIEQEGDKALFTFKGEDGREYEAKQLLSFGVGKASTTAGTPIATSFTLVLPLKTPLPVIKIETKK